MGNKTALVLSAKLRAFRNSLSGKTVLRRLPLAAIGLVFWVAVYLGTVEVLSFIRGMDYVGEVNAERFISMIFFSLMGFIFLSSLITALSSFYLSMDLPLLRTMPLENCEILDVKAIETVQDSSWMVLSFIPPVLAAMGVVYDASFVYYPAVVLFFVLFMFISSGTGIAVAHVLTWLFPAKRMRDILLLSMLGLFIFMYFIVRSSATGFSDDPAQMLEAILSFKVSSPYLPYFWMTETAMQFLRGSGFDLLYPALLLTNSAFFLLFSRWMGALLYRRNVERLRSSASTGRKCRGYYPGFRYALLWKDSKLFFRDTGQWSQLLIILALAFVYVYNFSSLPLDVMSDYFPMIKEVLVLINVLMAGLVLSAVSARFIYSSVSLEGRAFWIVKASPIKIRRFLFSKFAYGLVPVALFTSVMVALSNLMVEADGLLTGMTTVTVFLLSISVCGLGTGMGAVWPKFRYENISAVSMSLGGMVFMLAAFCLVTATLALEAWPYYLYLKAGRPLWPVTGICAVVIVLMNLAALYVPLKVGIRSLSKADV
jgi:ABC-2 type transport system permease protein